MGDFCKSLMTDQMVCLYFAAVLLLLLLIIMQLWKVGYFMSENMTSGVRGASAFTVLAPGVGSRGINQEFSGSNQGDTHGVNDPGIAHIAAQEAAHNEWLVSGRGEPDFWEITSELGAYKRSLAAAPGGPVAPAAAPAAHPAAAKKEWFKNDRIMQPLFENFEDIYVRENFGPKGTVLGSAVISAPKEYFTQGEMSGLEDALRGGAQTY